MVDGGAYMYESGQGRSEAVSIHMVPMDFFHSGSEEALNAQTSRMSFHTTSFVARPDRSSIRLTDGTDAL